jgi:hypothetical protein
MTENEIQRAVFDNFRQRSAPGVFAFHPKNGGIHQRGRRRGINAGLGVVSGVPDVIAIKAGQTYALELKTEFGTISEAQVRTMQIMQAAGATVALAAGLDDALAKLEGWGLLRGSAA